MSTRTVLVRVKLHGDAPVVNALVPLAANASYSFAEVVEKCFAELDLEPCRYKINARSVYHPSLNTFVAARDETVVDNFCKFEVELKKKRRSSIMFLSESNAADNQNQWLKAEFDTRAMDFDEFLAKMFEQLKWKPADVPLGRRWVLYEHSCYLIDGSYLVSAESRFIVELANKEDEEKAIENLITESCVKDDNDDDNGDDDDDDDGPDAKSEKKSESDDKISQLEKNMNFMLSELKALSAAIRRIELQTADTVTVKNNSATVNDALQAKRTLNSMNYPGSGLPFLTPYNSQLAALANAAATVPPFSDRATAARATTGAAQTAAILSSNMINALSAPSQHQQSLAATTAFVASQAVTNLSSNTINEFVAALQQQQQRHAAATTSEAAANSMLNDLLLEQLMALLKEDDRLNL